MGEGWLNVLLTACLIAAFIKGSFQGKYEKALLKYLFIEKDYDKSERPSMNDSLSLMVYLKFTLQQIIDVDEKNQIINTNAWLDMTWNDYSLTWDKERFGGISKIILSPKKVWRPDVLLYNSADDSFDATFATNVVVSNNGDISFIPPGMFKSTCKIDIKWFPFDDQFCKMKFGTWTHDGHKINLTTNYPAVDKSTYTPNGEWDLMEVLVERTEMKYECCPEPYIDITYTLHIRRRTLYVGINLIVPCVMISTMSILTFVAPPGAGEKISLGVTILLSLTVFLQVTLDQVPATSDTVPLTAIYFTCTMLMCSLSVVFTVLAVNFHHRNAKTHVMPSWVKTGICQYLAWILRMHRTDKEPWKKPASVRDLEIWERSSKSLLANVLDLDDNLCGNFSNGLNLGGVKIDNDYHVCTALTELRRITKELKYITDRMKVADGETEVASDWKFAAAVIDKLCLYMFLIFTTVASLSTLLSAPRIL